jgi:polysaccharide export outer membrane protein
MMKLVLALLTLWPFLPLCDTQAWAGEASIADSVHITVSGEVRMPGRYTVAASSSIAALLTEAGGVTAMGADTVYIERVDEIGQLKRYSIDLHDPLRSSAPHLLRDGDTVVVPHGEQYSIVGEVKNPGSYRLDPSMTVTQAIAKAGGVTVWSSHLASHRRVEIRRKGSDGTVLVMQVRPDDFVEPDDVIRVKESYF